MRKGDLVKLNVNKCFTMKYGGKRKFPLGNGYEDENGIVPGGRPTTPAEVEAWYNSDASKGIDCAGESKLPPRSVTITIHRDDVLVLERARCRVALGWGNPRPGMAKVMLPNGETAYLKRELLETA